MSSLDGISRPPETAAEGRTPPTGSWRPRLDDIVTMVREMSRQTDPQEMVRAYAARMRRLLPTDRTISLSRRGLSAPRYRITRFSGWHEEINPWRQPDRLPLLEGGLLAELIYSDAAAVIDDLEVDPSDPAREYLAGMRSAMVLPNFDGGEALNMVVALKAEPGAFDPESLPERVWMSNLFGRATQNLVLHDQLRQAYEIVDRELHNVAAIQRSLLPKVLPTIERLSVAAHYQTSQWAGGDYYDFLPLPDGRWGLLIADVSGHGTPAAVIMAITHTLAHGFPGHPTPPGELLAHVNDRLARTYTADNGTFVTAFYGVFDPARRTLNYASAGHNPPRLKRCRGGRVDVVDGVGGLPLGLFDDLSYSDNTITLESGDQLVLYTDGITEATAPDGRMYGTERLDRAITDCGQTAEALVASILADLDRFTAGSPPGDDRTLLIARVS